MTNAYTWMRICKGDIKNTIFKTWYGYLKYQIMFFGLSNVLVGFQNYIDQILTKKLNNFVIIQPDDI